MSTTLKHFFNTEIDYENNKIIRTTKTWKNQTKFNRLDNISNNYQLSKNNNHYNEIWKQIKNTTTTNITVNVAWKIQNEQRSPTDSEGSNNSLHTTKEKGNTQLQQEIPKTMI